MNNTTNMYLNNLNLHHSGYLAGGTSAINTYITNQNPTFTTADFAADFAAICVAKYMKTYIDMITIVDDNKTKYSFRKNPNFDKLKENLKASKQSRDIEKEEYNFTPDFNIYYNYGGEMKYIDINKDNYYNSSDINYYLVDKSFITSLPK